MHYFNIAEIFEEQPTSEFLESPMADGTIEEDFEAALTKGRGGAEALPERDGRVEEELTNGPSIGQESLATVDFSGRIHICI